MVNDVQFLIEVFVAVGAVSGPVIVIVRLIAGDGAPFERSRGIQEEEPRRWNLGSVA